MNTVYSHKQSLKSGIRAPDKVRIFISIMLISSLNPMFDHLLESSHRDDSNKWSNIGFGEEITQAESIEVHFTHLIWSPGYILETDCLRQYVGGSVRLWTKSRHQLLLIFSYGCGSGEVSVTEWV